MHLVHSSPFYFSDSLQHSFNDTDDMRKRKAQGHPQIVNVKHEVGSSKRYLHGTGSSFKS